MQNLIHGLGLLGNGQALLLLICGGIVGMVIGAIPGLSTVVVLSIILIFVPHLSITGMLCLFLGAQCGSFYSASVSSILLNTPGHPEAFPVTLDGYPMARNGQPGRALGLSACSTLIGGLIGCGVLIGFLQVIDYFPDIFHPPEFVALVVLAMLLVGTLGTNSVGRAIVSAGMGFVLGSIGPSTITGTMRYSFGAIGLYGGISLVALALGTFALPQMVMIFGTGTASAKQDLTGKEIDVAEAVAISDGYARTLISGIFETFRHWGVLIQSGLVGGVTGIIPGIGGFTGNFMAYGIARQTSRKRRHLFGTGIPEGIIAPEGSSLAKEAGHMIPILGLGLPGGAAGALFIGALALKNIRVGYGFQIAYPNITGEIVWIIALSGLIGTLTGVLLGPQLARVTKVPGPLIVPFIFIVCITGAFLTEVQFFAVIEVLVFAVLGLGLRRLGYPLGPFILGVVLGPTFETNIYLTDRVFPGLHWVTKRPITDVLVVLTILLLVSKTLELRKASKLQKAKFDEELQAIGDPAERGLALRRRHLELTPYPLLAVVMNVILLAVALYVTIYGITNYNFQTAAMPVVGGLCIMLPTLFALPRSIYRYVLYRKSKDMAGVELDQSTATERQRELTLVGTESKVIGLPLISSETAQLFRDGAPMLASPLSGIRDKSFGPNGQYRRELFALAWLFGFTGACWLLGFEIGSVIFMVSYGLTCTGRYLAKLHSRLIFTAIATGSMWVITYEMFHLSHIAFAPVIHF